MNLRLGTILLMSLAAPFVHAQRRSDYITLVYDVPAREFACWFEGRPDEKPVGAKKAHAGAKETEPPPVADAGAKETEPPPVADAGAKKVEPPPVADAGAKKVEPPPAADPCARDDANPYLKDRIYFYRGQTVLLVSRRAMIADQITIKVGEADLAIPGTPVFDEGTGVPKLTDLPAFKDFLPVPAVIKGLGVGPAVLAGGQTESTTRLDLFASVDRLDNDTFNSMLSSNLLTPTSAPNLQPLVSPNFLKDLQVVKDVAEELTKTQKGVSDDLGKIPSRPLVMPLDPDRDTKLNDFNDFLNELAAMNRIVERERALQVSVKTSGLVPHAQTIVNAIPVSEDPQFEPLRSVAGPFLTTTINAGPGERITRVQRNDDDVAIVEGRGSNQVKISLEGVTTSDPVNLDVAIIKGDGTQRTARPTFTLSVPITGLTEPKLHLTAPDGITVDPPHFCISCRLEIFQQKFDSAFTPPSWIDELGLDDSNAVLTDPCPPKTSNSAATPGNAPAISCIQPSVIPAGASDPRTLVVRGSGFSMDSKVLWEATPLVTMFVSDKRLLASVPTTLFQNPLNVKITVSAAKKATEAAPLTVWAGPVVESVELKQVELKQGMVTIRGSGFSTSGAVILWTTAKGVDHSLKPSTQTDTALIATVASKDFDDFKAAHVSVISRYAVSNAVPPTESTNASVHYVFKTRHSYGDDFLAALNGREVPINSESLEKLKANLKTLVKKWDDIGVAQKRAVLFAKADSGLQPFREANDPISKLQTNLNQLATASVTKASEIDSFARSTPLPLKYRITNVGTWYDNKEVTLTVNLGGRLTLFDVGGVGTNSSTAVAAPAGTPAPDAALPAAATTTVARAEPVVASMLTFRVHQLYHLQLAAGFVYAHSRDDRFQSLTVTPTATGGASGGTGNATGFASLPYITQTRSRNYNLLATTELLIFPWAQDYFPRQPRFTQDGSHHRYDGFAVLFGLSLTSPASDFIVGAAYFPGYQRVIGFKFGMHFGLRDYPPDGTPLNTPLTQPVISFQQKVKSGPFFGITLSQKLFRTIFTGLIAK